MHNQYFGPYRASPTKSYISEFCRPSCLSKRHIPIQSPRRRSICKPSCYQPCSPCSPQRTCLKKTNCNPGMQRELDYLRGEIDNLKIQNCRIVQQRDRYCNQLRCVIQDKQLSLNIQHKYQSTLRLKAELQKNLETKAYELQRLKVALNDEKNKTNLKEISLEKNGQIISQLKIKLSEMEARVNHQIHLRQDQILNSNRLKKQVENLHLMAANIKHPVCQECPTLTIQIAHLREEYQNLKHHCCEIKSKFQQNILCLQKQANCLRCENEGLKQNLNKMNMGLQKLRCQNARTSCQCSCACETKKSCYQCPPKAPLRRSLGKICLNQSILDRCKRAIDFRF